VGYVQVLWVLRHLVPWHPDLSSGVLRCLPVRHVLFQACGSIGAAAAQQICKLLGVGHAWAGSGDENAPIRQIKWKDAFENAEHLVF
jgi:hypothetical protein